MQKTNEMQKSKKICRECGCEIVEKVESLLYECERCIGKHKD
ncbi:YhfH family protein [Sporosarcina luteola]|nr:YhfH family protein [Sporosarcina luteola]MCM3708921.1 YhfH family protein [Sporosarcina luteola]MCM3743948.1 YhfH family protein [Sporosarcina luteola]